MTLTIDMRSVFILLFISMLTSCGKERTIRIKAINAATGEPYSGLEYRVASSRTAKDGEKYRTEDSGILDANGEAVVTLKQKSGRTYSMRVVKPVNTCYNKEITQYFDSPYDVNGTFTFEFAECSFLKVNLKNINCQNDDDLFRLFFLGRDVPGEEFLNGSLLSTHLGCTDIEGGFISHPMGKRYYKWEVTRNGITNTFYDTITLSAGEQRVYEIFY